MVKLGRLFGYGGECDPVTVVCEVEERHGDEQDPAGTVESVAGDTAGAARARRGDLADDGSVRVGHDDRVRRYPVILHSNTIVLDHINSCL